MISRSFIAIALCLALSSCLVRKQVWTEAWAPSKEGAIYYKSSGEGIPVIVIHGGPGFDHQYLFDGLKVLAKDRKVIFYDQRGTGFSFPYENDSLISLERFVEDLEDLRKALGFEKLNLMGHSFGGSLAMRYGMKYPHKLNSLVLLNSSPSESAFSGEFRRNIEKKRSKEDGFKLKEISERKGFKENFLTDVSEYYGLYFKAYFHKKTKESRQSLPMAPLTAFYTDRVYDNLTKDRGDYNFTDSLSVITAPTLIIHGKEDPIPWEAAQKIHQQLKNSQLEVYPNCGHMIYFEAQSKMRRSLRKFYDNLSSRR